MCLDNSPSNWKELYVAAILEIDKEQILPRIHDAKMAICDRVEELGGGGKAAERIALNQAMKALSELQTIYQSESQMAPKHLFKRHAASGKSITTQDAA
jgi:hypothetical protein